VLKTKILITGSNGLLGQSLINLFADKENFEIFAISRGDNRISKITNFQYFNVDITNAKQLIKCIKKVKPHFIINGAAMTNVDACELHKKECTQINVNAVGTLINCCREYNIHLIHISTDFIFDGKKGFYKEEDKPNPINFYGETKLLSENLLQKSTINFTILRTILVYGLVENANRGNIVLWVKNELENNKKINVIDDQFRMPTLSNDLAMACLLTVKKHNITYKKNKQIKEVYHISSNKLLSIYNIALQIANTFDLDKNLISKITTSELNQKAKRPPKTGFIIDKAVKELKFESKSFKKQLQHFKRILKDK
jgi:dTDP-4-dehydrorhamnose reductase